MNNNIIFAYRFRDDINELLRLFPSTYIYVDYDVDIKKRIYQNELTTNHFIIMIPSQTVSESLLANILTAM